MTGATTCPARGTSPRLRAAALAVSAAALIAVTVACSNEPDPDRPEGGGEAQLWVGDVETGDLSQFDDTPWNTVEADEPEAVSDAQDVREGDYAVAVSIPDGADEDPRSEFEPDTENFERGDERYFGFSTKLGADFPVGESWQVITQWKNSGEGSPPLSINVEDGRYVLGGGAGHPDGGEEFRVPLGPAVPGEWVDWIVHIRFSPNSDEGFVEVWNGNQLVLPRLSPETGTMYPDDGGAESYWKLGYYRKGDIDVSGTVFYDSMRIGTTREAVLSPAPA